MNRRSFLRGAAIAGCSIPGGVLTRGWSELGWGLTFAPEVAPGFRLTDVSTAAGIHFRHNNGAYGGKLLPETLGSGCAFLDYDADGWQDILLVNSMDWPGHVRERSTLKLYRNNRDGTFSDVTRQAGLDLEMPGPGRFFGPALADAVRAGDVDERVLDGRVRNDAAKPKGISR